jgi:hypothetical protein
LHRRNERAELFDDLGFRDVDAIEVIKDFSTGCLADVFEGEPEFFGIAEHRFMKVVDQLTAAFDHLAGKAHRACELAAH